MLSPKVEPLTRKEFMVKRRWMLAVIPANHGSIAVAVKK